MPEWAVASQPRDHRSTERRTAGEYWPQVSAWRGLARRACFDSRKVSPRGCLAGSAEAQYASTSFQPHDAGAEERRCEDCSQ